MSETSINEIDLDKVRKKYDFERDRRIRDDHLDQYIEVKGDFAYFVDDPYIENPIEREPLHDTKDVIIIGGGFGGVLVGAQLRKDGFEDIRIIDKAGDFGGTWYWNRYPGVQCDIESYIYLPLLEETGFMPSRKYSFGDEIFEYTKSLAKHFDLYRDACFQTEIKKIQWLEDVNMWEVQTDKGDRMRAKYLCSCNGPLQRPQLPGVPGIEKFNGHTFHTSRWDYDYTGGDLHGGLDKLTDKRVAIIGTGATALQCVPHLAEGAKHLYVVQRTPSSVDERNDVATDAEWFKSLEPGWQLERQENFNKLIFGVPQEQDLVGDGWTDFMHRTENVIKSKIETGEYTPESIEDFVEIADFQSMENIRQRVDSLVDDPDTAEQLKAYYRKWCKRPAFHDYYLQTFNQANVSLLDTEGKGLTRITENSIVIGENEYEVDCLIFATGYETSTAYTRRAGYELIGRNGLTISEKWQDGPKTQFGIQTRDFPNLFFTGHVQGSVSPNVTHLLYEQSQHIAHVINRVENQGGRCVDVGQDAEQAWCQRVQDSGLKERMEFLANCTPGYYNGEGGENAKGSVWEFEYSTGAADFFDILRDWRSVSHLPGLEVDGCALEKSSSDKKYLRSEEAIRVQLHREMKAYLHQLRFANAPAIGSIDTEQFRKMVEVGATMNGRGPELYRVEDHSLDSHGYNLPVRVYRGNENTDSIIMYFHGGGWCIGSIESYDGVVRRLAKTTGATIVSVDYRLAPEMPFPAAVDDASTALMWANNNRKMLAKKDAPLFVCGDSAGANLAAVLSLLGRDSLDIDIAGQVLIYPSVAGEVEHPDFDAFEAPFLNKEDIKWFFDQYVPRLEDRSDIRFAPINAESHAGLPPAFVMTAEFDLLKGQGEAYAEKLKQDGTDVHLKNYPGALHGFFSYGVGLIQSEEAIVDITSFINSLKH